MVAAEVIQSFKTVIPSPLAPFDITHGLSKDQLDTFIAIAGAILPGYVREGTKPEPSQIVLSTADYNRLVAELKHAVPDMKEKAIEAWLADSAASNADLRSMIERMFSVYASDDVRQKIGFLMNMLSNRATSFICTGSMTPFKDQPLEQRVKVLKGWSTSSIGPLREAIKSLNVIIRNLTIKTSSTMMAALDHPILSEEGELGKSFDFKFEDFPPGDEPATVETDILIVGSGCGAGVVAKNLSEAGMKIMVVEKSWNVKAESLPMSDLAASAHLYENGQVLPSDDGSIAGIYAGSTWGGGGAVNWSASLQTQGFVRREWAEQGLHFFETPEYQESLDRVCNHMGAHTDKIDHNHGNRVLMEGARRLGYAVKPVPQNTNNKRHYCGYCGHGCRSAEKMGPHNLWLPEASKGDTKFVQGFEVKEILFEHVNGKKTATGVRAVWTKRKDDFSTAYTREVVVKAKQVILSAGSLWSPVLLLKSGINSYNVGRNLHLHPCLIVFGVFEKRVKPCEGGILTAVVTEYERLNGAHGVKLECTSMLPSNCLSVLPWNDPLEWKSLAIKHGHMNAYISMVRDRDSGRVYADPKSGKPKVDYTVSEFDKVHTMEGIIAIAKILFNQGAVEIHTATSGAKPYIRNIDPGVALLEFKQWQADIRTFGLPFPNSTFATAHQMGSCRMGTLPTNSVVDPDGKVWGVENLYVMDASVFPSASGVNPMVTNMAISDANSRRLIKKLQGGGKK